MVRLWAGVAIWNVLRDQENDAVETGCNTVHAAKGCTVAVAFVLAVIL